MGIGSVLVGVAVAVAVGAYLARPFRVVSRSADLDRDIEAWVAYVRAKPAATGSAEADSEPVNFCSQCGRRVGPDDRFCPGCGTRLRKGEE